MAADTAVGKAAADKAEKGLMLGGILPKRLHFVKVNSARLDYVDLHFGSSFIS